MEQDFDLNFRINGISEAEQSLVNLGKGFDNVQRKAENLGETAEKSLGDIKKESEEISHNLGSVGNAFEDAFSNAIRDTQALGGNLGNVSSEITKAIPIIKKVKVEAITGLTGIKAALAGLGIGIVITLVSSLVSHLIDVARRSREVKREMADLNAEIEKGASSAASQIVALRTLAQRYREVGDSAEAKKKFLTDYAAEIKKTGIAINDVNTADEVFINNTESYVNALISRAKAAAAYNLMVQKTQEYLEGLPEYEKKIEEARAAQQAAAQVQGNWQGNVTAMANQNLKTAEDNLAEYTKRYENSLNYLAGLQKKYSEDLTTPPTTTPEPKPKGGKTPLDLAKEEYEKWAKDNQDLIIQRELALKAWERALQKEGEMAKKAADLQKRIADLRKQTVEEEDIDEVTPRDYLKKLQDRKEKELDYQKELLDIEILPAREKNNLLYNLEVERLDSRKIFLQQMYDLEVEDSEKKEELAQQIEDNENQRALLEQKRQAQRRRDIAEEILLYSQAAQAIADIFGTVAAAQEESIQRRLDNDEISQKQAEQEYDRIKGYQYAQTWINTLAGMTAALTAPTLQAAGPAGWIAAAAQAASILATGIANTIKIKNTNPFSNGTDKPNVPSPGNVGVTPLDVRNDIQPSPSMLPNSQNPQDTRVYILQSDLEASRRQVEIRENNSTF